MCEILNFDVPAVLVLPHSTHNLYNFGVPFDNVDIILVLVFQDKVPNILSA